MPKTSITASLVAAALVASGAGHARPRTAAGPVAATYQVNTKRFCVRIETLEGAEQTGTQIYHRQCLSRRQWRERGIYFYPPQSRDAIAGS